MAERTEFGKCLQVPTGNEIEVKLILELQKRLHNNGEALLNNIMRR